MRPGTSDTDAAPARKRKSWWSDLPFLVLLTLVIAALIRSFLVQPFFIPSGSMEQTLKRGDRVLVDKISYRFGEIQRGDVVVFNGLDSFASEVAPQPEGNLVQKALRAVGAAIGIAPPGEQDFIKRVIGVEGDRVRCCDAKGRVSVNGVAINEKAYLFPGDSPSESRFDVKVPSGRLWVMGDHRSSSADSRSHLGDPGGGTVAEDKVIGRAFSIVWPLKRVSAIGRPAAFDRVPDVALAPAVPLVATAYGSWTVGLLIALPGVIRRRRRRTSGRGGTAP